MTRLYMIGLLMVILALNIPEIRGDIQTHLLVYNPVLQTQLQQTKDKASFALSAVMESVVVHKKVDVDTTDNWSLSHKASITPEQFNNVLREYQSPAIGVSTYVFYAAKDKSIDPAYILYIFIHESGAGTNKNWIGYKDTIQTTHNPGNIICAGYTPCYKGFRDYVSWEDGFSAMIDLMAYHRDKSGDKTIDQLIARWAPPEENDTQLYIDGLHKTITDWRKVNLGKFVATTNSIPVSSTNFIPSAEFVYPKDKDIKTATLPLAGCLGDTVPNALYASDKLQVFIIKPGKSWSFNENWKIINENDHICGNQPYGGICDMATRYNLVAKALGMNTEYSNHPGGLNDVSFNDSVVIWSDGKRGGQDLVITNKSNKTAHFSVQIKNNALEVAGWLQ